MGSLRLFAVLAIFLLTSSAAAQTVIDPALKVTLYGSGLSAPVNMAFIGADDILALQKNDGRVRRIIGGVVQAGQVLDLNVDIASERGLLGIALHPQFPTTPLVYLYFTESSSTTGDTNGSPLANRVASFTWNGTSLINRTPIIDLPATPGPNHDGGIIRFGPDGKLYIVIGDLNRAGKLQNFPNGAAADDTSVILRLNPDGSTPADNPFASNADTNIKKYFAYGIRNSFGMAHDPMTEALWMSENGPNSYDEINLVMAGFNSGWQQIMGPDSRDPQGVADLFMIPGAHYADPKFSWLATVGPTALEFLNSNRLGAQHTGQLFAGDINGGRLYRFQMNPQRDGFVFQGLGLSDLVADNTTEREETIFGSGFGGITDIKVGPDGLLYILSYSGTIHVISPLVTVTRALAVASTNPNSGVSIGVSPSDNNGASSGTTPFNRTYNDGAMVALAAPANAGTGIFVKWQRDGIDHGTSPNTQVSMDANHTMTAVYASASEIVIDNAPVGQTGNGASFTGKWCNAKGSLAFGASSLQSCGKQQDTYRWTPTLTRTGNYDVYVWWSEHRNRSASVPVSVCHTAGCTTVNVNQQQNAGRWNLHGRYNLNAGTAGYVQVTDQNGRAVADAVRFVPAP